MGVVHTVAYTSGTASGSTEALLGHGGKLIITSDQTMYFTFDDTTAVSSVNSLWYDRATGRANPLILEMPPGEYTMNWVATASGVLLYTQVW